MTVSILVDNCIKFHCASVFHCSFFWGQLVHSTNLRYLPQQNNIAETTEFASVTSYLDLLFTRNENNYITTKLYEKCVAFGFPFFGTPSWR